MTDLTWTDEPPEEEGFYRWRFEHAPWVNGCFEVYDSVTGLRIRNGGEHAPADGILIEEMMDYDYQFAGPLPTPSEPETEPTDPSDE